jgi:hypothetical protein
MGTGCKWLEHKSDLSGGARGTSSSVRLKGNGKPIARAVVWAVDRLGSVSWSGRTFRNVLGYAFAQVKRR